MSRQSLKATISLVLGMTGVLLLAACATAPVEKSAEVQKATDDQKAVEIKDYEGKKLSPFEKEYITSMAGPQEVDIAKYRLVVDGLVEQPLSLTYEEAMALPGAKRVVTLHCYDGWQETLLFDGIRLGACRTFACRVAADRPGLHCPEAHVAQRSVGQGLSVAIQAVVRAWNLLRL